MKLDEKKKKKCNIDRNCNVDYQQTSLHSGYNYKYKSIISIPEKHDILRSNKYEAH